jgi:hypothetical protein
MRIVRESSLEEYALWYLQREARKPGSASVPADTDARVETMRQHHAGKMRPWFDASTQWRISELDESDLADLVFLESSWTIDEGLVVPDGPNYRLLRRVADNAIALGYLGRETAHKHKEYYDKFVAGTLRLTRADRIAICSAEPNEVAQNPSARYYLLDGVGRCLPYMILVAQDQSVPRLIEAFVAEKGSSSGRDPTTQ